MQQLSEFFSSRPVVEETKAANGDLASRLGDYEWSVRRDALNELRDGDAELRREHQGPIVTLLKDGDNDVRLAASQALLADAELRSAFGGNTIVALLKDEASSVRLGVAQGLLTRDAKLRTKHVEVIEAVLFDLLKDASGSVRLAAAKAVLTDAELRSKHEETIVGLLKDESGGVRLGVATAMLAYPELSSKHGEALVGFLKGESSGVRAGVGRLAHAARTRGLPSEPLLADRAI